MRIRVNVGELDRSVQAVASQLRRYAVLAKKDIGNETRMSARRVAVNLAFRTQPFGNDPTARARGEGAVRRDVNRAYWTTGGLYKHLLSARGEAVAKGFYAAAINNDIREVRRILTSLGMTVAIRQTPDPRTHRAARDTRTGRVPRRHEAAELVLGGRNRDSLRRYANRVSRRVGYTASGWAAAAAQIGGTRGIPAWKSKRGANRAPGRTIIRGGDRQPTFILVNSVPWVWRGLPWYEISAALRREESVLRMQIQYALRAARRKANMR